MNEFIELATTKSGLKLKINKGEHFRIMKNGWFGSIWIHKTETKGFRLETTGSVATHLNPKIEILLGRNSDSETKKGYKLWYIQTQSEIDKIIEIYGKI